MKRNILTAGALIAAPLLLTACGSATDGDQVPTDKLPEAAPAPFGEVDYNGFTLQCDKGVSGGHGVIDYVPDAPGFQTQEEAAQDALASSFDKETLAAFDASTTLKLTASAAVDGEGNKTEEVTAVQFTALDDQGLIKGVVITRPTGKGGYWLGTSVSLCEVGAE